MSHHSMNSWETSAGIFCQNCWPMTIFCHLVIIHKKTASIGSFSTKSCSLYSWSLSKVEQRWQLWTLIRNWSTCPSVEYKSYRERKCCYKYHIVALARRAVFYSKWLLKAMYFIRLRIKYLYISPQRRKETSLIMPPNRDVYARWL